ncbi:MAG: glycosyltransferase family 1 protein [Chloroflexi bacterium]|nr:MAG: glycosyltransferase family 1 protein [Chloroflexota bacterium]
MTINTRQRLLYVVNIPRFFVTHRLPLALAAHEAGYEVHIATADDDAEYVAQIKATGLPFHPLPLVQHSTNPLQEVRTMFAIYRLFRRLKPDVVHLVSAKPIIYGGIAARIARLPAVVSSVSGLGYAFADGSSQHGLMRALLKQTYKLALGNRRHHIIFQNPDDQQLFIGAGINHPTRMKLIRGSGVDMNIFTPQPEADGQPVVLFAGRLMWQKGVGAFVEMAQRLKGRARFVIAGYAEATHPDTVSLAQLQQWHDDGIIEWWGRRDDMPQVFAQAHIVCLPSTYGEGVPKVLIEAAACARPVVTTDTPGCREIVRHDENGLLVPPGDVTALSAAVSRLLDDAALRQQMGSRGREIALHEFSLEYVLRETLAFYRTIYGRQ